MTSSQFKPLRLLRGLLYGMLAASKGSSFAIRTFPNSPSAVGLTNGLHSMKSNSFEKIGSWAFMKEKKFRGGSSSNSESSLHSTISPATVTASQIVSDDSEFIKPQLDTRSYRVISLGTNNLTCLLISDPMSDVESGSVHVHAGHFEDPNHRPGLAHFHEHMLFMGTEKYDGENDFEAYLSRNGGYSNAYTDMEDTNYYFAVAPLNNEENDQNAELNENNQQQRVNEATSSSLAGALDRFGQFFVSPLFREDAIDRELRAVDSEYNNALGQDNWRSYQLLKSECNPDHPFHKFGCGNYYTLTNGGDMNDNSQSVANLRPDLVKFWEDHYHSGNLKLSVLGRASLDNLQATVEQSFADVRPPVVTSSPSRVAAFGPSQLGILREVVPVKETRTIRLSFLTPSMDDEEIRKYHPSDVISHLLGHESPGSLHALLNDLGYLNGLSSGTSLGASDFSMFGVSLALTPKGMEKRDEVLDLVFQWIALIRKEANNDTSQLLSKFHDEICQMNEVGFRFSENGDPTSFCSSAADKLTSIINVGDDPATLLRGSKAEAFSRDAVQDFMGFLRPENALITVNDSGLSSTSTDKSETSAATSEWKEEKWYGAKYRQIVIASDVMEKWNQPPAIDPLLKLPDLNKFIPSDFSLRCEDDDLSKVKADELSPTVVKTAGNSHSSIDADKKDNQRDPPNKVVDQNGLRVWTKMDRTFRVPKTSFAVSITSPKVYQTPRTITLCRLFEKVLGDDLNSLLYDAMSTGSSYSISVTPSGFRYMLGGYSEKIPDLLNTVTSRIVSLIGEMKEGKELHPDLHSKFQKATINLLRQTKNCQLDSPLETANYNGRVLIEESVWHLDNYLDEFVGVGSDDGQDRDSMTMEECAIVVEESIMNGRLATEALVMGNIRNEGALELVEVLQKILFENSPNYRPLSPDENPSFRSLKLPTKEEAKIIFPPSAAVTNGVKDMILETPSAGIPTIYQSVAVNENENNNAIEITMQTGCESQLGYEGIAILQLISHMAYPSAFNQLRTKEQLGYIVSCFLKSTAGGAIALCVDIQSATTLPEVLEERFEAWLVLFREELEMMTPEVIAMEAEAVIAGMQERDQTLSQEISRYWGEILGTQEYVGKKFSEPDFDRIDKLAGVLMCDNSASMSTPSKYDGDSSEKSKPISQPSKKTALDLKHQIIDIFDKYLAISSQDRRVLSARVYGHTSKEMFENNIGKPGFLSSYDDVRQFKQYLSSWPNAPYWGQP